MMTMAAVLLLAGAGAQTWPHNPVVMEVGGQKIAKDEFMKDFMSSVGERLAAKPGVTEAEKRQALDEYVELYATFRAKLKDAYALGFDTMPNLIEELKTYRDELAAPYLAAKRTLGLYEGYQKLDEIMADHDEVAESRAERLAAITAPVFVRAVAGVAVAFVSSQESWN